MDVNLRTIPHESHRYETIGDYFELPDGKVQIQVSNLGDWKMEALIQFHELVEFLMCRANGVTHDEIDQFDHEYEQNRPNNDFSEPGDDPNAPYRYEHLVATGMEKILAAQLGVKWDEYEKACNSLPFRPKSGHPATQGPVSPGG